MSNMKMNLTDRFNTSVEDVTRMSTLGNSQGEYDATLRRLNNKSDSMGVIEHVLAIDKTLYVIASRVKPLFNSSKGHDTKEYYNCLSNEPENYDLQELFLPVINIDLSRDIVDPRKFLQHKVLVTEIDHIPVKVEFIGQLDEINESPLKIARTVLRSFRNFLGPSARLDEQTDLHDAVFRSLGYESSDIKKMLTMNLGDLKEGTVFNIKGDGHFYQDTAENQEGVVSLDVDEESLRHANKEGMKTKKCHLPIKIFSGR